MQKITVALVDDQNIFRQILGMAISVEKDLEIIGSYANGKVFLEAIEKGAEMPRVAILDIDMPSMNGIELNAVLQERHPLIRTIILSQHMDDKLTASLIAAGASAYLDKGCRQEELFLAVRTVHETGYYMNKHTLSSLTKRHNSIRSIYLPNTLSDREVEILVLLCEQNTNFEIAEKLHISVKTVDFHRANLIKKTSSRNVAGLVMYAIKNGLISI